MLGGGCRSLGEEDAEGDHVLRHVADGGEFGEEAVDVLGHPRNVLLPVLHVVNVIGQPMGAAPGPIEVQGDLLIPFL